MIWSLIGINVAVFSLSGYSLYQSRLSYEKRAEAVTQNAASAAAINVANNIEKIDLTLLAVVDELERQANAKTIDAIAMNSFLAKHELRMPEIEALRIANAEGLVVAGEANGLKTTTSWSDRDYFRYHREHADRDVRVAKPLPDPRSRQYLIHFTRRYNTPDGRFAGVVAASVIVDDLTLLLSGLNLGSHGTISLRDSFLALVTRFPPIPNHRAGQIGDRVVSEAARIAIGSGADAGTYKAMAQDGIERIYSFRRVKGSELIVSAGMAREDYLAGWTNEAYKTFATLFLFLFLSMLSGETLLRMLNGVTRESRRNRMYLQCASDGIQILNVKESRIVEVNDRLCEMLGYGRDELLQMKLSDWIVGVPPDDLHKDLYTEILPRLLASPGPSTIETRLRRSDGMVIDAEVNVAKFYLENVQYVYASYRDIGERKLAEEKIWSLAYFDPLTQLPNRRLLMDRLGQGLIASDRSREYGALLILDLDNFNVLNDTQGHDAGDRMLIEVGRLLVDCVRKEDTVARLSGDEYAVLIENLGRNGTSASRQAELIAEKFQTALSRGDLTASDGQPYHCTASIGMTLFVGRTETSEDLLKQADAALYQAKDAGRDSIRFYDERMQELVQARLVMEADLRRGLQHGELHLHYQPQIDHERRLTGAEALLRWRPPGKPAISPMAFIPLAEETGLIIPIGRWVMQTACGQLRDWAAHPTTRDLKISINISPRQFRQPDFVDDLRTVLSESGANPALLKIELTESVVLENLDEVIERMLQIKTLGVTFSLDDFGTGFSSLSYLKRLPLDQVKIDQSFVRDVATDTNDAAIVRAIIAMSQSLGMDVIAEGVETNEQLSFLRENGCRNYQGYLFSCPLPPDQFEAFAA